MGAGNPSDIVARRQQQEEGLPDIILTDLSGLSVKLDQPNQPANVWKNLTFCDLYIPGSIRKVLPPVPYGVNNNSGFAYVGFINYWAQPNKTTGPVNRLLGIAQNNIVYNVTTGAVWADLRSFLGSTSFNTVPYLEVYPTFFNPFNVQTWHASTAYYTTDCILAYGSYDGKYYIFSPQANGTSGATPPAWRSDMLVADGSINWAVVGLDKSERFQENALIVLVPGKTMVFCIEYQFNPDSTSETPSVFVQQVGVQQPMVPPEVVPVTIAQNLDGYYPVAGRGYVYTLYDPHTFHESSPSPFAGPTQINDVTSGTLVKRTIPGSLLPPLPVGAGNQPYQSYQSYYVAISAVVIESAPSQGYEQIFVYATRDGGATFYRVMVLLDWNGNVISNSDGSVNISTLEAVYDHNITDEFPLTTTMFYQWSYRVYEGSGPVNLVPDPQHMGPQSWSSANANQIIVVQGGGQPGPTGQSMAAAELPLTGSALPKSTLRSSPFPITRGQTYFFQAFVDATTATAGVIRWDVVSPDFGTTFASMTWAAGSMGYQSTTFNVPTASQYTNVRLRIWASGVNGTAGDFVAWSNPEVFLGGAAPTIPTNYPTADEALILPAPAPLSQQPPPVATEMQLYGGCLFVIEEGTFNVWYSNTGDFQSWGAFSHLPLDDTAPVPILELARIFDRLIIGKSTSLSQVSGSGPTGFQEATVDPNHGVMSIRATIGFGSSYITLLNTGICIIALGAYLQVGEATNTVSTGFRAEHVIGDPVKPITDVINPTSLFTNVVAAPASAIDTNQNFYIFSFLPAAGVPLPYPLQPFTAYALIANMAHVGPSSWSLYSMQGSAPILAMKEILRPDLNTKAVLYSDTNHPGELLVMFGGTQGTAPPLPAVAETWPLPDLKGLPPQFRDSIKVFHEMWVEGEDIPNWQYQISVDYGATYSTPRPLQVRNKIAINGRQIQVKFTHSVQSNTTPLISFVKITQSVRRQASGQNGF